MPTISFTQQQFSVPLMNNKRLSELFTSSPVIVLCLQSETHFHILLSVLLGSSLAVTYFSSTDFKLRFLHTTHPCLKIINTSYSEYSDELEGLHAYR